MAKAAMQTKAVMAGFIPAIHVFSLRRNKERQQRALRRSQHFRTAWFAGTIPE
jgi:hypothetical protein